MTVLEQLNSFYENMLSSEECCELLQEYAKTIDGFVIYGATHTGIHIKRILEKYSLNIIGFLDEFMEFDEFEGKKVFHSISDLNGGGMCAILATNLIKSKKIMEMKLKEHFSQVNILEQKVLFYCYYNRRLQRNDGFFIESMCIINTNICTLKCRGCSTMTPQVEPKLRKNFEVDDLKWSIKQLSKIADAVNSIEILGGEPLLHPQLAETIYCLREQPNIFQIVIDTNGTIMPSQELLNAMAECDVIVRISDYGEVSAKKTELYSALISNNIITFMRPVNAIPWSDYGEIYDRGSGDKQFANCRDRGTNVLYKGRLYFCGREFRYVEKNLYAVQECTCVDLSDDIEKARKDLKMMMNRTIPTRGCRYCGDMDVKIEAGIQEK